MMYVRPLSRVGSRAPSPMPIIGRTPDGYPYAKSPSNVDFEIERVPKTGARQSIPFAVPGYENSTEFRDYVSRLLEASNAPFTVSGRITLDASQLILFFRIRSGITHSLDFPVDVDYNMPPPLEVLIGSCRPHQTAEFVSYPDRQSLYYPTELPVKFSLDLADHPILDAVRNTLFPNLPSGHYLSTVKDKLEIVDTGSRLALQPHSLRKDGRTATIVVTLPSRFEGGALIVRNLEGQQERYLGRGGKIDEIEWTAFLPDCEYEIEPVQRGCRISISYGVFLRTFGPNGPNALIRPSDEFLDRLAPVLNLSRGRKIAFYLEFEYSVNPAESLAESTVPFLKGGDSLLYHAIKLYKLTPELHWTAGGYMWPTDRAVDFVREDIAEGQSPRRHIIPGGIPFSVIHGGTQSPITTPPVRGLFSNAADEEETNNLRRKVEDSGAIPLAEADITILTGWDPAVAAAGKERVYFVSGGKLEKLVVNILLVVFVP